MRTVIHTYHFDSPTDPAYVALRERLTAQGLECLRMNSAGDDKGIDTCAQSLDGQVLELETAHLFDNQWNTAPNSDLGLRVFDWYERAIWNYGHESPARIGHYLEQTDEMRAIRANTLTCGYCSHQRPKLGAPIFCPDCLDSEYLKESDLKLTRLQSVAGGLWGGDRPELSEAERAELLPKYIEAQLHGSSARGKARLAKQRADILHKAETRITNAKDERDGLIWLLDHGIKIDNVIYYDHKGIFSFGWRSALDEATASALLDLLVEFKYPYELKRAEGVKVSTRA